MSALLDDRYLDAQEARADTAMAAETAERKGWLAESRGWLLESFAEANPQAWAAFQQAAWDEYAGGDA